MHNEDRSRFALSRNKWQRRAAAAVKRDKRERSRAQEAPPVVDRDSFHADTGIHERLLDGQRDGRDVDRKSRADLHPIPSLRPRADDPWWMRLLRAAGRGMQAHHKSIAITVACIVATLLAAALIWEGRIPVVGIEPPREERAPWNDSRHERRRQRRGEPVAPGTAE